MLIRAVDKGFDLLGQMIYIWISEIYRAMGEVEKRSPVERLVGKKKAPRRVQPSSLFSLRTPPPLLLTYI